MSDNLASLVKQIDDAVAKNEDQKMAAFVVMLTDEQADAEAKLKDLAKSKKIENVPLTLFENSRGPGNYKISPDAEVTVLMWKGLNVRVNHSFAKGKLDAAAVTQVVADTAKILE